MSKIPLKWTGALFDTSGYAAASRNYVGALLDTDRIDLTLNSISFEKQKTTHGKIQEVCKTLYNRPLSYNINLVHLTPENYPAHREQGKYNIAYTVWETDKLPDQWVPLCNSMDEIWVPSKWNQEIFKNSGVIKPIYVIPHGISVDEPPVNATKIMGIDPDVFVFYSIFQWIERKNPVALLRAYLTEFHPEEKVCLSLKTYRIGISPKEQALIKEDIVRVKKGLQLTKFPPIRFFGNLFSSEQMASFHDRGDCFVLPHRAEGFGIPHAEAMAYGKPVISSNYSGNLEFMNEQNSYLIDTRPTPVANMIFPNYHGHMTWGDPSIDDLKKLMRYVYENKNAATEMGATAKKHIEENYNWSKIGNLIADRLETIQKEL